MITIQPEIEILSTESYEDMLRRIEKIGRVCYKSEERIGEGTAEKFIAGIPESNRGFLLTNSHNINPCFTQFYCQRSIVTVA